MTGEWVELLYLSTIFSSSIVIDRLVTRLIGFLINELTANCSGFVCTFPKDLFRRPEEDHYQNYVAILESTLVV